MNITMPSPLEQAKDRLTIPDVALQLFPGWKSGRSCKSPFREDRHASFSVYDEGRKFKDHATGEQGDVIDFFVLARGISKSEAARELIALAGTTATPQQSHIVKTERVSISPTNGTPRAPLQPMPAICQAIYDDGVSHLLANESLRAVIERWRAWPAGTVAALADHGLIACPVLSGRRGVAFPVQAPTRDELGILGTLHAGFHHRHKPAAAGERPRWTYRPNDREDNASVPSLPFVLGAGFLPGADTIIVTEGQWDAITLAAAAGWLASDAAWPEPISVFATRGTDAWRTLIEVWSDYWLRTARFVLFQDADAAGDRWKAPGGFVEALVKRGHRVRLQRVWDDATGAKDLNDVHRHEPLTAATINDWLAPRKTISK